MAHRHGPTSGRSGERVANEGLGIDAGLAGMPTCQMAGNEVENLLENDQIGVVLFTADEG